MTISTSTAMTYLSVWISRVLLILSPVICMTTPVEEMNRYQLGDTALPQVRPHRFELRAVGKALAHFYGRVGFCPGSLGGQFTVRQRRDHLPVHDTTFLKSFGSVFSDNIFFLGDQ